MHALYADQRGRRRSLRRLSAPETPVARHSIRHSAAQGHRKAESVWFKFKHKYWLAKYWLILIRLMRALISLLLISHYPERFSVSNIAAALSEIFSPPRKMRYSIQPAYNIGECLESLIWFVVMIGEWIVNDWNMKVWYDSSMISSKRVTVPSDGMQSTSLRQTEHTPPKKTAPRRPPPPATRDGEEGSRMTWRYTVLYFVVPGSGYRSTVGVEIHIKKL